MDALLRYIDGYCERLAPGLFAEPVNALTNFAFIIAAVIVLAKPETRRYPITIALSILLGMIGVGSLLFHTFANVITSIADVTPIVLFTLTYIYAANHYFLQLRKLTAFIVTMLFLPYAWIVINIISTVMPWIGSSTSYIPILLLFPLYSLLLWQRLPIVAKSLAIAFLLLAASISFRWLDDPICTYVPLGTHFIWHILNAILLAWVIKSLTDHLSSGNSRN